MRKTKTIKHKTPDPLAGMTPDQTADALSALESLGGYQVDYNPETFTFERRKSSGVTFTGDPPNTLSGGTYPFIPSPATIPDGVTIGTSTTGTTISISVNELLEKLQKLEQQVDCLTAEIRELRRQGHGFKRKKNI